MSDVTMSKEDLVRFALEHGITVEKATSLLRNISYRESYNRRPDVVAKRRERNKVNWKLTKSLRAALR